ncbi:MAG: hypothetical protein IBJ04_16520 [Hydrogenophaga sp.]|jgi:hypothetical protein|uniref:Uncharacterized protein n=1 Tax=Hydrogenophaga crocea TaxID=2716225 RepID=A0A6G8IL19_9BURK|nr:MULTISPECIES: hypothetical protein [Hydrogenophaga]MBL0945922.1 hypothetical protein [Hydrogenophaga sp.]QIM53726.1 hypothetical protein G9Q37_16975 [Hydrogenophaga crocea]
MKTDPMRPSDEEYTLPPTEALLAGTLALMTGCAQHTGPVRQRELMVGKVVSNLTELSQHPALSAPMRLLLGRLSARWLLELGSAAAPSPGLTPMPEHRTLQ